MFSCDSGFVLSAQTEHKATEKRLQGSERTPNWPTVVFIDPPHVSELHFLFITPRNFESARLWKSTPRLTGVLMSPTPFLPAEITLVICDRAEKAAALLENKEKGSTPNLTCLVLFNPYSDALAARAQSCGVELLQLEQLMVSEVEAADPSDAKFFFLFFFCSESPPILLNFFAGLSTC